MRSVLQFWLPLTSALWTFWTSVSLLVECVCPATFWVGWLFSIVSFLFSIIFPIKPHLPLQSLSLTCAPTLWILPCFAPSSTLSFYLDFLGLALITWACTLCGVFTALSVPHLDFLWGQWSLLRCLWNPPQPFRWGQLLIQGLLNNTQDDRIASWNTERSSVLTSFEWFTSVKTETK